MKQFGLLGEEEKKDDGKGYTSKIKTPIYEPKNRKPHIMELLNNLKANRLIQEIEASGVTDEEKEFLKEAARRHYVFNYKLIADYYAHAGKEMQQLMEKSALVIIDFDDAIRYGYVKLSEEIADLWYNEYGHTNDEE